MLSKEFLAEAVVDRLGTSNQMTLLITQHYLDRLNHRDGHISMSYSETVPFLKRLARVKKKIARIELGHQFWVVDHTNGISFGLRRQMDQNGIMQNLVGTIVTPTRSGLPGLPNGDRQEIINMP